VILAYVAVCPRTGLHLRDATDAEAAVYRAQRIEHPSGAGAFRKAVRVGEVLVDEDTGPGGSHTPGRFL
jgi:hypothetical protein